MKQLYRSETNSVFGGILGGLGAYAGVATLIGLAFGIYPARQAAKENPIDALRYE